MKTDMTKASDEGKHVALTKCYYCGGDNEILLHKRLGDVSAFHGKVVSMHPCSTCEGYMKMGIILITINDARSEKGWERPKPVLVRTSSYGPPKEEPGMPNPFRTGGFFVISEDAFKRAFTGEGIVEFAMRARFMFMEHNSAMSMKLFHHGMTVPFREAVCQSCKHEWLQPVELSKSTSNLSGEKTAQCPLCAGWDITQGPIQQPIQQPKLQAEAPTTDPKPE